MRRARPPLGQTARRTPSSRVARALLSLLVAAVALGQGNPAPASASHDAFVQRSGTELTLDGAPWRFTGVNIYNANSDGWCGHSLDVTGGVERAFDELGPGQRVVRAWFFQPLALSEDLQARDWTRFDRTVQAARERGIKLIATLSDHWGECGAKVAGNGTKDAAWYSTGYTGVDPGMLTSYRDYVAEVVARYSNEPAIAMWQLMNEAETKDLATGDCTPDGHLILRDFAADVSGLVKSLDPNHLVSLGTMGGPQCGPHRDFYGVVHDVATIDVCEYHDYSPDETMPTFVYGDGYDNGLATRIDACHALGKPIFVGESGIPRSTGLAARAEMFAAKRAAQFAAGVVGYLAWDFSQIPLDGTYDIRPGDPALHALRFDDRAPDAFSGVLFVDGATPDRFYLLFNDLIDPWSIPEGDDFSVRVDGGTTRLASSVELIYRGLGRSWLSEALHADGLSLVAVHLGFALDVDLPATFSYSPGTRPLRDDFGNLVPAFVDRTFDEWATVDPTPFITVVDEGTGPDRLLFALLGTLEDPLPPAVDFTVRVNGAARAVREITDLRDGDPLSLLALDLEVPIEYGDDVILEYAPGAVPLRLLGRPDPVDGFSESVFVSVAPTPTRSTPAGSDVPVMPVDSSTGISPAAITFGSVTAGGTTSIASSLTGPALPAGFQLADRYYDITTTATFNGSITVCMSYPADTTGDLRLLHHEGGSWVDVTTSVDLDARVVCGETTSLSPFVVAIFGPHAAFSGFKPPVEAQPTVNRMRAGSAVPVRFGLGGDFGLAIFAPGYPASQPIQCESGAPSDAIEVTVTAGESSLSYDASTDTYQFVWKTDRRWTGCRELILRLTDGSEQRATFRFHR